MQVFAFTADTHWYNLQLNYKLFPNCKSSWYRPSPSSSAVHVQNMPEDRPCFYSFFPLFWNHSPPYAQIGFVSLHPVVRNVDDWGKLVWIIYKSVVALTLYNYWFKVIQIHFWRRNTKSEFSCTVPTLFLMEGTPKFWRHLLKSWAVFESTAANLPVSPVSMKSVFSCV